MVAVIREILISKGRIKEIAGTTMVIRIATTTANPGWVNAKTVYARSARKWKRRFAVHLRQTPTHRLNHGDAAMIKNAFNILLQ
jgi:hypothetical protein